MTILAGYELLNVLGQGSMGLVFRAHPVGASEGAKWVAVKRVPVNGDADLMAQLSHEAMTLARLDHPNVVRIHEVVPDGAGMAIVMEYVVGGSVADALRRTGRLTPGEVGLLAGEVADALAGAHGLGLVHCDVKPSNVLLGADGRAKLSDFGLARCMARASLWGGAVLGTAEYLDPAVAEGGAPGPRSDVYSLGVMCYEALTGRLPYLGATPLAVLRAADRGKPVPVVNVASDVPIALAAVIEAAMARHPDRRPASAAEMAAAVRGALGSGPAVHGTATIGCRPGGTPSGPPGGGSPDPTPEAHSPRQLPAPGEPGVTKGDQPGDQPLRSGPRALLPRTGAVSEPRLPRILSADEASQRHRRWIVALAAAVLAVVAVVLLMGQHLHGSAHHKVTQTGHPGSHPARARCRPAGTPPLPADAQVLAAGPDSKGCATTAVWFHNILSLNRLAGDPPARFALGQPGDDPLLGDWDCSGRATPALYRPSTGEVFYFGGWAPTGKPLPSERVALTGVRFGRPVLERRPAGCDLVTVLKNGRSDPLVSQPTHAEAHERPSAPL
ncbi:MAG: hypothetical protein DLM54_05145 [Acidimicrobiales bacterium]|nr:MAG: hypothetical protein DLM54_05145 [Acidimicrobiales bacterium]